MTSSIFPDINVWFALSLPRHSHFAVAREWFEKQDPDTVLTLCRHTQLGWFRLMTTKAAMREDALTQRQCWKIYDTWIESGRARMLSDPADVEVAFRRRSGADQASPKEWADAYLAAFAEAAGLTLVTFDRALAAKAKGAVLLR